MIEPVLKYPGGKRKQLDFFRRIFPKNATCFVDAMTGSASVALGMSQYHAGEVRLNELNPDVIGLYAAIRVNSSAVVIEYRAMRDAYLACETLTQKESLYLQWREIIRSNAAGNTDAFGRAAAAFLACNFTGFNGLVRVNQRGIFNVPFGQRKGMPDLTSRISVLGAFLQRPNIQLHGGDFAAVTEGVDVTGWVIYYDPPYAGDKGFRDYTKERFPWEEQVRLLHCARDLAARGATAFISNAGVKDILDLYAGVGTLHRLTAPRAINRDGDGRGNVPEVVLEIHPC